ncbi:MAG: polysaccharide pyruvyl transferase family protein [Gammaproteobacteria bacterium]|nr:polysaccharide pyruvyl transferase family protein [Gammaproteobacteria bacterium]
MRIYTWQGLEGNVGDALNAWMWPKVFGCDHFSASSINHFIGIGSILDGRHAGPGMKLVFGAGARGPDSLPDVSGDDWRIAFVRGPNTAAALGMHNASWISDPAIIVPLLDGGYREFEPSALPAGNRLRVGFVPYFATQRPFAEAMANAAGLIFIPPTLDPERFLSRLLACDVVIVEAMHGAILADAFGIPWLACRISSARREGATHDFKWTDWGQSLDLNIDFVDLPYLGHRSGLRFSLDVLIAGYVQKCAGILRRMVRDGGWQLSDRAILEHRQRTILLAVEDTRELLTQTPSGVRLAQANASV